MKKNFKKLISVFLSVVMVITVIPATSYAMEDSENDYEFSAEEVSIEYEVESKRTENSKTYLTEDGGYYQVSTAVPIHKEVCGEWQDIESVDTPVIETSTDATNFVTMLASRSYSSSTNNNNIGISDNETLTMYSFPITEYNTKYLQKTDVNTETHIYVKPNLLSEKSVFIHNAIISLSVEDTENTGGFACVYPLKTNLVGQKRYRLSYENILYDSSDVYMDEEDQLKCDLDITEYCHYCSLGLRQNKGLAIVPKDEETYIPVSSIVMSIYYEELGDVDNGIESEIVDMGRAGIIYINDYTCSPTIVRNDFGLFDELAEVNIQTIINPSAIDNNSSDGTNTRSNYYSVLQSTPNEYYWKNCEGNYIYFKRSSSNLYVGKDSVNTYLLKTNPLNGYDITIEVDTNDNNNKTTYSFTTHNSFSYLEEIKDGYGNIISIDYNTDYSRLTSITDGSNREYCYNYDDSGMLSYINVYYTDNGEKAPVRISGNEISINYYYDLNNRLTKVIYPDEYTIDYIYDENGRISEIITYNDSNETNELKRLSLSYFNNTGASNVIQSYSLSNKGVIIESIELSDIENNTLNRTFTNKLDLTTKIVSYNTFGDLVYYKDYNNQEYYLNYTSGNLDKLILEDSTQNNLVSNGNFESENSNDWHLPSGAMIVEFDGTNNKVLKTYAENNKIAVTQNITGLSSNETYILTCSLYCKGTIPPNNKKWISAKAYFTNGSDEMLAGKIDFDYMKIGAWQTGKALITLPSSVTSVKISLENYYMPDECYFDNVSLYPVTAENTIDVSDDSLTNEYTLAYNDNGTVSQVIKQTDGNISLGKQYSYDSNNYLSSVNDEGKTIYYNYDKTNGLLINKGKNSDNAKNASYTYNGIGALTQVKQAITSTEYVNNDNDIDIVNQITSYTYDDDLISTITHNGCTYKYSYNNRNQVTNISVRESNSDDAKIDYSISYEYSGNDVGKVIFGNGSSIIYTYNGNCITSVIYDNGKSDEENVKYVYLYEYDNNGKVTKMTDTTHNIVTTYSTDGYTVSKNGTILYSNNGNRINLFGRSFTHSVSESENSSTKSILDSYSSLNSIVESNVNKDFLNRNQSSQITNKFPFNISNNYQISSETEYRDSNSTQKTNLVERYVSKISKKRNILSADYDKVRLKQEWNYTYDDAGRITAVFKKSESNITYDSSNNTQNAYEKGDLVHYYRYDEAGQISLEINLENGIAISYVYDCGGNLKSKIIYSSFDYEYNNVTGDMSFVPKTVKDTISYTYKSNGMKDYLVSYDGQYVSYDESGNPINYAGRNEKGTLYGTMTWNGNLLTSFRDGSYIYDYTYDADGRRTSKTYYYEDRNHPRSTINYIWEGDTLVGYQTKYYEKDDDGNYVLIWDKVIKLLYNDKDLVGVIVEGTQNLPDVYEEYFDWDPSGIYSFIKDGQGNITNIYDTSENVVISLYYDAYGNISTKYSGSFIEKIENDVTGSDPIIIAIVKALLAEIYVQGMYISIEQGFKGYIYDRETGLYYNQERYYSPAWGRFINASDPMTLTEDIGNVYNANLFNYCNNDPINNISNTGFNSPCITITDSFLPQLNINKTSLFRESRSNAAYIGEITNSLNILGLKLSTTTDATRLNYWKKTFNSVNNTIETPYGMNYINSVTTKQTSSVTKYEVKNQNSPYKTAEVVV